MEKTNELFMTKFKELLLEYGVSIIAGRYGHRIFPINLTILSEIHGEMTQLTVKDAICYASVATEEEINEL